MFKYRCRATIWRVCKYLAGIACIVVWGLWTVSAQARPLDVSKSSGPVVLGHYLDILEDPSRLLAIQDIVKGDIRENFVPSNIGKPQKGFSRAAWWVRFTLVNTGDHDQRRILEFGAPTVDRVAFYRPQISGGYQVQVSGDSIVGRQRDIAGINDLYQLTVPAHASKTFYVRYVSDSSIAVDMTLWSPEQLLGQHNTGGWIHWLFFGILLSAAFYSFFIYLLVRQKGYAFFAAFMVFAGLLHAESYGYMAAYVWPETTWLSNISSLVLFAICIIMFVSFSLSFLQVGKYEPWSEPMFRVAQVLAVIGAVVGLVDFTSAAKMLIMLITVCALFSFYLAIRLWVKGAIHARMYIISWSTFYLCVSAFGLEKLGVFNTAINLRLASLTAFSLSAILFTVAFTDRFNRITRQKEKELEQARDDALEASRAKSKFLSTMSHELRTPLNHIIGFSEILATRATGPINTEKYTEYAQDIHNSGRHLLSIINDLLEISKIDSGQFELDFHATDLPQLVKRCLRLIEDKARDGNVTLTQDIPEPFPQLFVDESSLQKVISNILYNAVKFTPANGKVHVSAIITRQGKCEIQVRDNGIGIATEHLSTIIEPFNQIEPRLTRKYGGIGLGLAIAKLLIEAHDGSLHLESNPGKGTQAIICLPPERLVDHQDRPMPPGPKT